MLGDGAYLNTGLIVPHRKRPGRPLLRGEEEETAKHRTVHARVQQHAVQAVARIHNRALAT